MSLDADRSSSRLSPIAYCLSLIAGYLLLIAGCLSLVACGTPGAPQPPSLNLAKPVEDLKAVRTGNHVLLTWTPPRVTTDGAGFRHPGATKICRVQEQPHMDRCVAIGSISTVLNMKTASATEPVEGNGPQAYSTFAIEVENDRGRAAGLSNQVEVPAMAVSQIADVHSDLTADAVVVSGEVTPENTVVKQTLELRRRQKGSAQETTAAQIPAPESAQRVQLRDETFDWEKTYEYRLIVSADALLPNGPEVRFDGAVSAPLEVVAHDVFPPAVPSGVQAVYSGATQPPAIDLTWNPDTDRDLAGYFVYRRAAAGASAAVKLNDKLLPAPAFSDSHITAGATYFYSVSAVDVRGNESQRSQEASEFIPK